MNLFESSLGGSFRPTSEGPRRVQESRSGQVGGTRGEGMSKREGEVGARGVVMGLRGGW